MTYGLRIKDANGNVTMDTSTRMGRVFTIANVTDSGSYGSADFAQGTPWFLEISLQNTSAYLTWSVSGNVLTWTRQNTGYALNSMILFGVY